MRLQEYQQVYALQQVEISLLQTRHVSPLMFSQER